MPFPRPGFSGCELPRWFKGRVMEWEDSIVFSFHSSPIATNCIWGYRGQASMGCTSLLAGYVQLGQEVGRGVPLLPGYQGPSQEHTKVTLW